MRTEEAPPERKPKFRARYPRRKPVHGARVLHGRMSTEGRIAQLLRISDICYTVATMSTLLLILLLGASLLYTQFAAQPTHPDYLFFALLALLVPGATTLSALVSGAWADWYVRERDADRE